MGDAVVPMGEVADVTLADIKSPLLSGIENRIVEPDGEQHKFVVLFFFVEGAADFVTDSGATDGIMGEDDDEFVVEANPRLPKTPSVCTA